jgi:hypothetical protein
VMAQAAELGQEGAQALVHASAAYADRCREMAEATADIYRAAADAHAAYMNKAFACQTLNAWMELSRENAQGSVARFLAGSARMSDIGARAATEVTEPLATHAARAVARATEALDTA